MCELQDNKPNIVGGQANIADDAKFGSNVTIYSGVTIASGVCIGNNVVIYPGCYISASTIEDNCTIGINNYIVGCNLLRSVAVGANNSLNQSTFGYKSAIGNNNIIVDSVIETMCQLKSGNNITQSILCKRSSIESSHINSGTIGEDCTIGPFARIRPNSVLANNVKVGNFCEIKNSNIGSGSKVSHLAYVGDATVGKNCNIGCGVIFANYNGRQKSKIFVDDDCFVGSNCNLIAPVVLAKSTYVCAGTTVTDSTEPNDFVIGRARPVIKPNRPRP